MAEKLTTKQARFCAEYVTDGNATRAAIAAGYSAHTARQIGQRLLTKVVIQAEIERRKRKIDEKLELSAEKVLREISLLAFSNMADYIKIDPEGRASGLDLSQLTREQMAAIQEITEDTTGGAGDGERRLVLRTRFKLASKVASLELLGKHFELFTDKLKLDSTPEVIARLTAARTRLKR